jgi:hypothetical protein
VDLQALPGFLKRAPRNFHGYLAELIRWVQVSSPEWFPVKLVQALPLRQVSATPGA